MTGIDVAQWEEVFAAGTGFRRVTESELRMLARHIRPQPGQRALDIGCGLGGYAAGLAGLGYRTLAVDWAQSSIAAVRDRYAGLLPNLQARRVDFEDAAAVAAVAVSGGFALVAMRLVYAFMGDKAAAAERVRGLLAPGGVWVVTTPLVERLPRERAHIGLSGDDVAVMTDGWGGGCWYDLEPGGLRCYVLRRLPAHGDGA